MEQHSHEQSKDDYLYRSRRHHLGNVRAFRIVNFRWFNQLIESRYTARTFPRAQVVILEPESLQWPVPANCTVEKADVEYYQRCMPCDYLFVRNVRTARSYKTYLSHLRHLVRRGGEVEIVDIDDIPSKVCTCQAVWTKATTCNTCLQFPDARARRDLMREAGFCDLKIMFHQKRLETPDNTTFYW